MGYLRLFAPILIVLSGYSFVNACSIDNLVMTITYDDTPDCIRVLGDTHGIIISNECSMKLELISSEDMTTSESTASFELNEGEDISIDSKRDEQIVLWSLSDGREGRVGWRLVQGNARPCPGPFGCVTVINHAHSSLNLISLLIILMGLLRYRHLRKDFLQGAETLS